MSVSCTKLSDKIANPTNAISKNNKDWLAFLRDIINMLPPLYIFINLMNLVPSED